MGGLLTVTLEGAHVFLKCTGTVFVPLPLKTRLYTIFFIRDITIPMINHYGLLQFKFLKFKFISHDELLNGGLSMKLSIIMYCKELLDDIRMFIKLL